jgi:hydrogenase nickel incorporation protein HypA/HybF
MTVTQTLLNMVLAQAAGRVVTDVRVRVGVMSSMVPDSVAVFFDYLSRGTVAEGAQLHFETVPLEITCQACGARLDLTPWTGQRPQIMMAQALTRGCRCGSRELRPTGGLGFDLISLEVEEEM